MPDPMTKPLEEYSDNPHTVRSRKRKNNLDGVERVADAAKSADYKAKLRGWKLESEKASFKTAPAHVQVARLTQVECDVMAER